MEIVLPDGGVSIGNRAGEDRRRGDRRRAPRDSPDRRRQDRRLGAAGLLVAAATLFGHARAGGSGASLSPTTETAPSPESPGDPPSPSFAPSAAPLSPYDRFIEEAAALHGVSADLVRAVIQVESNFNPRAVSPAGAKGLMQLAPITARAMGINNPFDPRQNIFGGVRYLRMLLEKYDGNVPLALAGYNAGPTAVRRHRGIPPYKETRGYVRKVTKAAGEGAKTPMSSPTIIAD